MHARHSSLLCVLVGLTACFAFFLHVMVHNARIPTSGVVTVPRPIGETRRPACFLRPGDIILWSGNYRSVARCVEKAFLKSPFTHISLVVHEAPLASRVVLLEAVRSGVHLITLRRALMQAARDNEETAVTRALVPPLNLALVKKLRDASRRFCGAPYAFTAWKALMHSWTPHLSLPTQTSSTQTDFYQRPRYCSELVACVFETIGLLHNNLAVDAVMPHHFSVGATGASKINFVSPYFLGAEVSLSCFSSL